MFKKINSDAGFLATQARIKRIVHTTREYPKADIFDYVECIVTIESKMRERVTYLHWLIKSLMIQTKTVHKNLVDSFPAHFLFEQRPVVICDFFDTVIETT